MKVFLDANILVSVLNKEYPVFGHSARLLSLAESKKFSLYTSPVALAIAFYFAEKKSGKKQAREKIGLLTQKLAITTIDEHTVQQTADNKRIHDFEDGLQYYSAINSGCTCIVTEDRNDFYFAETTVVNSEQFMDQYVYKSR